MQSLSKKRHETHVLFPRLPEIFKRWTITDFPLLFGNMAKPYNDNIAYG